MTEGEDGSLDELRADEDRALVGLLRSHGRDRLPEFALGTVAGALSIAIELAPSYLLGLAIDAFFTDARPFDLPLVPKAWLPEATADQFLLTAALIGLAYGSAALLSWANSLAWNHFAQFLQHEIRIDAFAAMQRLGLSFFDDRQTGEVMSVLNNDVNQLEEFLTTSLNNAVRIAVRVAVIGALMVWLNWQLAAVALLVVPFLAAASYWFVGLIQPKYSEVRDRVGSLNARLENTIGGIGVVKAYANEDFEVGRVEEASRDYRDTQWDAISTRVKFFPALRVITAAGYLATFLLGGWWVLYGPPAPFTKPLSAGVLVTFLLYSRRFRYPMRRFGEIVNDYQYAEAAAERIVGLLRSPPTIPEADDPVELDGVEGRVEYDGVSFAYDSEASRAADGSSEGDEGGEDDRREPSKRAGSDVTPQQSDPRDGGGERVLENVSFDVEPGEFVGIVGPTGAGKTTLLKLLVRFYDVDAGEIRLDGHDVREIALDDLRGAVGYVSQEPYLFHGTVRENVAYGLPDVGDNGGREWGDGTGRNDDGATATDADGTFPDVDENAVREAARRAGAHEFVTGLEDGYDTVVGERGVKLSGGQRQRIAIARALLRDPPILVLDEATSHVDNETELLIQEGLADLAADRTTFAIAHRLSTVRDADRILVVDDGRIVEEGTHEELLEEDGLYASLWSVQVGAVERLPEEFRERIARRRVGESDD